MDLDKRYSRLPDRDYSNFREMFDAICAEHGSLIAARAKMGEGRGYTEWSYADMRRESFSAARYIASRGLKPGDRLAIIAENRPEWCFAYIACVVSGLVVVPIDSSMNAAGLASILASSKSRAIAFSSAQAGKVAEALAASPIAVAIELKAAVSSPDSDRSPVAGAVSWAEAVSYAPGAAYDEGLPPASSLDGGAVAAVIYTSGTTGIAKGIMLSHRGILANVNAAIQSLNVGPDDNFIVVLPLHHTYAATCSFLAPLEAGGCLTFVERIVPSVILRAIRESKVTFMIGVPMLFDKIKQGIRGEMDKLRGPADGFVRAMFGLSAFCSDRLDVPAGKALLGFLRAKAGLGTVRLGVSGGGPLSLDTAGFFETLGFNLVQGYGMSENGPLISVNLPEYKDNRSVGLPVKHTLARIAEPGSDGVGEIQVKSPSLMLGYIDDPEASAEAMTADGWLRTGDLGFIDARGFIFITGRSKSIIVTAGGKNVYPEELEMKFEGSKWIREALVIGRKLAGDTAGEQVVAVCVPDWDAVDAERGAVDRASFAADRVRDEVRRVNKGLPPHMKIVDSMVRNDEFEKTSTRKIRRFLYSSYAQPIAVHKAAHGHLDESEAPH